MRLIDADALEYIRVQIFHGLNEDGTPCVGGYNAVLMSCAVKDAPTVDAVEVVRCKDCKQWRRNVGFTDSPNGHCFCIDMDTNQYDFCSCGERRDSDV